MAGAILILVFGNQFLDWRWLGLIAAVTFPIAYFRTGRRVPSAYPMAQILDDRLPRGASASTAVSFRRGRAGPVIPTRPRGSAEGGRRFSPCEDRPARTAAP